MGNSPRDYKLLWALLLTSVWKIDQKETSKIEKRSETCWIKYTTKCVIQIQITCISVHSTDLCLTWITKQGSALYPINLNFVLKHCAQAILSGIPRETNWILMTKHIIFFLYAIRWLTEMGSDKRCNLN